MASDRNPTNVPSIDQLTFIILVIPFGYVMQQQEGGHATISAKPVIKHHIGDVTRFMPTSLKIKRDGKPQNKSAANKPGNISLTIYWGISLEWHKCG